MSDRELPDLRSRVRIDTSDIEKADRAAKGLGDTVRRQGDATEPLQRGLRVSREEMAQFGASMTRYVTLPVAAGAAVALKMSTDFETTFTQMQGLAGVTAEEVDGLRESVLDLSGETARSPQDVAEGLYFIRSAGLEGAAALEALDVSAKAAAVGLGETQQVADAVTSAVNSYGQENLSAAAAADVLTAAVREGKGEASAMAPQLGRLLPIAAELGVEFGEVAGGLSFLTRGNGDAAQSATQLNGVLQKILRPTEQAKEALAGVGLSGEELRRIVDEQGLLPALQVLEERMGTNSDAFKAVFDDTEGLTGALALLRNGGTEAAGVIDSVTNSSGDLAEAFDGLSESDAFKLKQDLAELQATAVETGAKLAPALTDIASAVGTVVEGFGKLPSEAQTAILALGLLAAAAGPVASSVANVSKAIDVLKARTDRGSTSMASYGTAIAGVALAAAGLVALGQLSDAIESSSRLLTDQAALAQSVAATAESQRVAGIIARQYGEDLQGLADSYRLVRDYQNESALPEFFQFDPKIDAAMSDMSAFNDEIINLINSGNIEGGASAIGTYANALIDAGLSAEEAYDLLDPAVTALMDAESAASAAGGATEEAAAQTGAFNAAVEAMPAAIDPAIERTNRLRDSFEQAREKLRTLTDAVLAGFDADLNYEDALRNLASARDQVTLAEEDIRINGWTPERQAALDEANRNAERSALSLSRAELARAEAHAEAEGATLDAKDRNDILIGSLLKLAEDLDENSPLRQRLAGMIEDLREYDGEYIATLRLVSADGPPPDPDNAFTGWTAGLGTSVQAPYGGSNPMYPGPPASTPINWGGGGSGAGGFFRMSQTGKSAPVLAPVVNVQVTGEPDAMTLKRLERVATDAVRKGINDAGVEVGRW